MGNLLTVRCDWRFAIAAVSLVLVASACVGDDASTPTSVPPTVPATAVPPTVPVSPTTRVSDLYGPRDAVAGEGTVNPNVLASGQHFVVTPSRSTERRCADEAAVVRFVDDRIEAVGFLAALENGNGIWQVDDGSTPVTFLACGRPPSAWPAEFQLPDLPPGRYRICLWRDLASCGSFDVLE